MYIFSAMLFAQKLLETLLQNTLTQNKIESF